jgi:uncharacterized protein YqjF (DUF2071 family)
MPRDIDRIAPTLRPAGRIAMRQRWAELLFLHWPVPVEAIRPLIPEALEVDTFDGVAYVGLVPFTMTGVRYAWAPAVPGTSRFHETNVRTYVHLRGRDPGVWFFSLDAANALAVRLARAWYKLPYHHARMELTREADGWISYRSERGWPPPAPATCAVRCRPHGALAPSTPGTLQHFLVERYFLYAHARGGLFRGQVHHPAYEVQQAEVAGLDESLLSAAGLARPDGAPLALFSPGVDVDVYGLTRV